LQTLEALLTSVAANLGLLLAGTASLMADFAIAPENVINYFGQGP